MFFLRNSTDRALMVLDVGRDTALDEPVALRVLVDDVVGRIRGSK